MLCQFLAESKMNQLHVYIYPGFPGGSVVKNPLATQELQETQVRSPSREDPLEDGLATHSSVQCPCLENPMDRGAGVLQSIGLQRVRHG